MIKFPNYCATLAQRLIYGSKGMAGFMVCEKKLDITKKLFIEQVNCSTSNLTPVNLFKMLKSQILRGSILFVSILTSYSGFGQDTDTNTFKKYKAAFGIIGNHKALGIQGEYKSVKNFGAKAIMAKVFGYEKSSEYGYAGIALLTYYIPTKIKLVEPVIGVGGIYTLYHWTLPYKSGDIHDVNFGGGFGINFRFSDSFRTGINIFVANGYNSGYRQGEIKITSRQVLILPTLTLEFLL